MPSYFVFSHRLGRVFFVTVGLLILLFIAFVSHSNSDSQRPWLFQQTIPSASGVGRSEFVKFGELLFEALDETSPNIPPLHRSGDAGGIVFWRADADTPRPDVLVLEPDSVVRMKEAHDEYLEAAQHIQVPYAAAQRGIVSTASGASLPVFMVSLRMLRRTGCTLPVELFLGTSSDYEPHMCSTILPSLNARCVVLEDSIGAEAARLAKFQFKIFSILFSTFEEVLFLDSDNLMVEDPSPAFTREPFLTSRMVTWQDFWASSTSKHLYSIQNKPVPAMNLRASTESGQLLVSKRSHGKALLMAAYYNYYGPGHYYELLSQGGFGAGDKETFVAGAEAVDAPFHQVGKCVDTVGYYDGAGYHGVAMLQYDPTQDAPTASEEGAAAKPRPWAMHHNYPKVDPVGLFGADGAAVDHATGGVHRLWGERERTMERFGKDVEEEMWEEIRFVACELGEGFRHWRALPSTALGKGTCDRVVEYQAAVFHAMGS